MKLIKNKKGEGHTNTAMVIIIAVIVGSLILGGLVFLFIGSGGVFGKVNDKVDDMMDYTQELRYDSKFNPDTGSNDLQYSYDGKTWYKPNMPAYSSSATVYKTMKSNSDAERLDVAVIKDGTKYYVLNSTDGGLNWTEQVSFTASSITHCYFGTSSALPYTSGSFSGEKFVVRFHTSGKNYYTMTSFGHTWTLPTWSDMIPL